MMICTNNINNSKIKIYRVMSGSRQFAGGGGGRPRDYLICQGGTMYLFGIFTTYIFKKIFFQGDEDPTYPLLDPRICIVYTI